MFKYSSYTKGLVEHIKTRKHDVYMRDKENAKQFGVVLTDPDWMRTCDGVTMHKNLAELVGEIRRASFSALQGRVNVMSLYRNSTYANHFYQTEVGLYREGDTFLLGVVGYDDSTNKYYLSNPNIMNDKYNPSNPEHYAVQSSGKDRIVRMFKKFCSPPANLYNLMISAVQGECEGTMSKAYNELSKEVIELEALLIYSTKALNELWNIHKGGSISPDVITIMEQYFKLKTERDAEYARTINLVGIMFSRLPSGLTLTRFCHFGKYKYHTNLKTWHEVHTTRTNEDRKTFTTMGELPEEVMGKVSVLSMVEDMSYIRNVGYKFVPTLYVIELDENVERAMRIGCTL